MIFMLSCSRSDKSHLTGSGIFEGTEIIVSAKTQGEILRMNAAEGTEVQQGDTLALIDVEKLSIQREQILAGLAEVEFNIKNAREVVDQAQDSYENTRRRYERIKSLFETSSATQQQMDDADMQFKTALSNLTRSQMSLQSVEMKKQQVRTNLKLIENQMEDGILQAPVSGVIIDKFVERGELIGPGLPVAAIADLSQLWIKLYVVETELGHVMLGSTADIFIDSFPDKAFTGKVAWISTKAEFTPKNVQTKEARADLVYAVKIVVPNPDGIFKIGMPADIRLEKK